jgi:histidinol dehydrogenase
MMKPLIDGSPEAKARLKKLFGRGDGPGDVEGSVREIIAAVRRNGDRAVARYTKRFDGVTHKPGAFAVDAATIRKAAASIDRSVDRALRQAHRRIVAFHKHQLDSGYEIKEEGLRTGIRVQPLRRVGVYVPGGKASYPSSVLMNVVPAKVAGVDEVVVVTPPSPDGVRPEVLAAAAIAGADQVLAIGGAQAVAALAYGTESIGRVDKIVGPGNIFVATAKRLVFGAVDIDSVAGPSEVLVIADGSADPALVAADLLAQAEHDELAASICITTSAVSAKRIAEAVEQQLKGLSRAKIARASIRRYGSIFVVPSLARAAELSDEIAPEHLEIFTKSPRSVLRKIRNAGAVFLGEYSTESLGDYAAGPNHVLPTGGAARFSSPLGVYDFRKRTSIIEATRKGLERLAPIVTELAAAEGLQAHGAAVTLRTGKPSAKSRRR